MAIYVLNGTEIELPRNEDAGRGYVRGVSQQIKERRAAIATQCDAYLRYDFGDQICIPPCRTLNPPYLVSEINLKGDDLTRVPSNCHLLGNRLLAWPACLLQAIGRRSG